MFVYQTWQILLWNLIQKHELIIHIYWPHTKSIFLIFFGETKKRVLTRSIKHRDDSMAGKWETSGATEHSKYCHGWFNWLHPKTLSKLSNINERKIRESLEINNLETNTEYDKSIKVLHRSGGNIVNTNLWKPLFLKIKMVRPSHYEINASESSF